MKIIADLFISIIETALLFYFYNFFFKNFRIGKKALFFVYILDFLFCFIYSIFAQIPSQRTFCFMLFILFPLFFYREKFFFKITITIIYFSVLGLSELLVKAILLGYRGDFLSYYKSYAHNYLLGAIFSKTISFLLIYLSTFLYKIKEQKLSFSSYFLLLIVPTCSVTIFYYLQNFVFTINQKNIYLGYIVITLALLTFNLLFFFLFSQVSQTSWLQAKLTYEQKIIQEQENYYKELALHHKEIRQLNHDMNNHLLIIYNALIQDNIKQATNYIEQQLELLSRHKVTYSGYLLLDTVLFYKKQLANQQQTDCSIFLELTIEQTLPEKFLNDTALILASCFDNALEATSKIKQEQKRWIKIRIYNDSTYIYIQLENSVADNIVIDEYELPKTTKKNSQLHGLGLSQVKKITELYQGQMVLSCKDKVFTIGLMIKYHSTTTF